MAGDSITIGSWSFSEDADGNLVITNGTQKVVLSGSDIAVGGNRVLCDGDPVVVSNDQGTLNGTTNQPGPGSGWQAATYWTSEPDGDSNLTVKYGTVG